MGAIRVPSLSAPYAVPSGFGTLFSFFFFMWSLSFLLPLSRLPFCAMT